MELSACVTDDDYEMWRRVRIAVQPYERCDTVAELRRAASPDTLFVLARVGGAVVGSGLARRSDVAGGGTVVPRVLPQHRRAGIGTALLHRLSEHCATLGVPTLRAGVDDEGSLSFAQRFGFVEVDREVEQTRTVGDVPTVSDPPPGVEVVTASEHPGLWRAAFERFGREVLADFATTTPLDVSAEQWDTGGWCGEPMFLGVHDGQLVGCAGLLLDPDEPGRAENALTAVRRDWRGRGLAVHLKLRALEWAADHGISEVYTWTQDGNAAMRGLNERLGYATTRTGINLARDLPLD